MSCRELFAGAASQSEDCPIRVFPRCHPKAHIEVHVHVKRKKIYFSCSKCDRPISTITLPK